MDGATGGPPYEPPYDPIMIRDYILCKGGGDLDKLQVIKIASIAYGYVLAMTNKRLFRGGVEAWAYGPVVPAIYETLKEYNGRIGEAAVLCDGVRRRCRDRLEPCIHRGEAHGPGTGDTRGRRGKIWQALRTRAPQADAHQGIPVGKVVQEGRAAHADPRRADEAVL